MKKIGFEPMCVKIQKDLQSLTIDHSVTSLKYKNKKKINEFIKNMTKK
jgi:hypothetical protein